MNRHTLLVPLIVLALSLPAIAWAADENPANADDLFGGGGGYFHPYVTTAGLYDDNVYRTANNKVSDWAGVLSPGIWIAVPGTREWNLNLDTSTLTPGGLRMVEDRGEEFQTFRGFLHYGADLTRFQDTDDNDTDDHRLDAMLQYNFSGGLTVDLVDLFVDGHDDRGDGVTGDLDTFTSNLLGGRATYDIGSRFRVRGEYGHYTVNYDTEESEGRDRADDKYSAYLYYKLTGKSTVFTEYDFTDISYDDAGQLDSNEQTWWGGLRWRLTGKTMGEVKMGYLVKDYKELESDNNGDFVLKGWLDYELTGKTSLKFVAARTAEEPDVYGAEGKLDNSVGLTLTWDMTPKITANLGGDYARVEYEGQYLYQGVEGSREDDEYTADLYFDYQIQRWLSVRAKYTYFDRDSTIDDLSYEDNRVMLSLSLAM